MNSNNVRIDKELYRLQNEPILNISVTPNINNKRELSIVMLGPNDSPYEGGKFKLEMFIGENYPFNPPKIRFLTKIYHPNIDRIGRICLDILKTNWTPALQIRTVLLSLQSLLSEPNISDPLDPTIGTHWKENKNDAIKKAIEYTKLYAI